MQPILDHYPEELSHIKSFMFMLVVINLSVGAGAGVFTIAHIIKGLIGG
jgi:uncharacterized membrane protein